MSNIRSHISHIQSALLAAYPADESEALAWWVAEELTGLSRTELQFGCKDTAFSPIMQEKEQEIITRLLHFEPIQYVFGHTLWCGLDLKVTPATLIPRPETAELVERINKPTQTLPEGKALKVLDIGTGSGCIAIALKKAHPSWSVTGIDISPEAIETARENARRNEVDVRFEVADIFSDETEDFSTFDVVVSNPPYICEKEKKGMRENVLKYEPARALFVPDDDPLIFYRRIAELQTRRSPKTKQGEAQTSKPFFLFFEINEALGAEMKQLLESLGYSEIQITKDIYGKDRIIEARMA